MPDTKEPTGLTMMTVPWKDRKESERRLSELFRSRASGFEIPLRGLTEAALPLGELIIAVLSVAKEYDAKVEGSRKRKAAVAVEKRNLLRLARSAVRLAKRLQEANELVIAQLNLPDQLADWQWQLLSLPDQLKFYGHSLRYVLEHAPRRPRGRRYGGEARLCRWVELMAGEKFYDGFYDHLALLLQYAAVFWHPERGDEPAPGHEKADSERKQVRDHFSAEALRKRIERRKRGEQKPVS